MPLALRPPRQGKTPNFEIRGTYLGVTVERSAGTHRRSVARSELRKLERAIERGEYPPRPQAKADGPTFLSAAVAYLREGGSRRGVAKLIRHFGEKPLSEIDQAAIDAAAVTILPTGAASYRNTNVYTPISAILHKALGDACPTFKRPKGAKGRARVDFMWPDDAFAVIAEAEAIDGEFGLYLRLLLYTGIRKSEGLDILRADARPDERAAWLRTSKNEDPRMLRLREDIVLPLLKHLQTASGERLFKFNDGGHFKHLLLRATMAACGMPCPKRRPTGWKKPKFRLAFVTFHIFRHTWATWMRMYGGADLQGLKGTNNWKDLRSVARYAHVVPRDEWDRVDRLPSAGTSRGKAANE